jgi:hypothetical protein
MDGACGTNGGEGDCLYDFAGKKGKKTLGRTICRCMHNIKMNLRDLG